MVIYMPIGVDAASGTVGMFPHRHHSPERHQKGYNNHDFTSRLLQLKMSVLCGISLLSAIPRVISNDSRREMISVSVPFL